MKLSTLSKFAVAIILSGFGMSAFATNDITGKWQCSGYDPQTKDKITMTGEIKKTGKNTYSFKDWTNIKTGEKLKASGVQNQNHDENFAIVYWADDKPGYIGFGIYELQSDGNLAGHRTTKEGTLVGEELCTRMQA